MRVVRTLRDADHEAYFVGGCVRDELMGLRPKDYDVATSARPDEVLALFNKTLEIGVQFGVVAVLDEETPNVQVEVATFRSDGAYVDGRHPEGVHFSNPREDAARRDFTINGLFHDPFDESTLDLVGGQADIKAGVIRAIGDPNQRFDEDKLRMLRAVRFACRFNFEIEPVTWGAVCEHAESLSVVSAERVQAELNAMFVGPARGRALRLLFESALLDQCLPEVAATIGVEDDGANVFSRTLGMLDMLDADTLTERLAWAVVLHGLAAPRAAPELAASPMENSSRMPQAGLAFQVESIMKRLRQSNELSRDVADIVASVGAVSLAPEMSPARLKRYLRHPHIDDLLLVEQLRALSIPHEPGDILHAVRYCREGLEAFRNAPAEQGLWPPIPVDGGDLQELGLSPGPQFRVLLNDIETEVLEGRVGDRESAIAFVKSRI